LHFLAVRRRIFFRTFLGEFVAAVAQPEVPAAVSL
jgi:hypothetical protein